MRLYGRYKYNNVFIFRVKSCSNPTKKEVTKAVSLSPVYKTNLNYIRKRQKKTITMEDLEKEKDLEEDEFKTNVKPSTRREMTTRICKKDVIYQFDESDHNDSDLDEDTDESIEDEQDEESFDYDGYSSPDIDYEAVANYEENSIECESTKIYVQNKDQENESHLNADSNKSDDLYNYDPGCDYE